MRLMSVARGRFGYRNNPLVKVNHLRRLHLRNCLGLRAGLTFCFGGYKGRIASEQVGEDVNTGFLISRDKESLLPIDHLVQESKATEFGKLVRVGSAQFHDWLSV